MKRFAAFAMLSLAMLAVGLGAFAQDRKITILNFANRTGDDSGTTMVQTTQGIISSSIKYIGAFRLLPTPGIAIGTDLRSLKDYANVTGSDYILFGGLEPGKDGAFVLKNSLYCRADDSLFDAQESVESALAIFSASDSISLTVLSEMHKMKIRYGALRVQTDLPNAKYDVFINDVPAASNIAAIESIPDGDKTVRVVSREAESDGRILFDGTVAIEANRAARISVSFPKIDPRLAGKTDVGLLTITSQPAGLQVCIDGSAIVATPVTIEAAPGPHSWEAFESCAQNRYYEGQSAQSATVKAGEETLISLKPKAIGGIVDTSYLSDGCRVLMDGREVPAEGAAAIQAGFYFMSIFQGDKIRTFEQAWVRPRETYMVPWGREVATSFSVPEAGILFKDSSNSWDDIKPVYKCDSPKMMWGSEKYNIASIKFARDAKYFYWHIDFKELNPLKKAPDGSGGVSMDLVIGGDHTPKILHAKLGSNGARNLWYDKVADTMNPTGMAGAPSIVQNQTGYTGRLALAAIAHAESPESHFISFALESGRQSGATKLIVGWTDFGFLQKN